jgi:hypothetical protein
MNEHELTAMEIQEMILLLEAEAQMEAMVESIRSMKGPGSVVLKETTYQVLS